MTEGLRVERSRQLWEGMNLVNLGDGLVAKLAGPEEAVPVSAFDAAYTVGRNAYSGVAELEILDWRV
jgi:hypothetical protein